MGAGCLTLCVPMCLAGGVIAGVVLDVVTLRGSNRVGFLIAGSGVGLLTGAMGCVCAGPLGLLGLLAGFGLSAIPGLVAAALARRPAA